MSKKKKNIWWVVASVIVAVGFFWYFQSRDTGDGVTTESVRRGDVAQTVSVTGRLVPKQYADLSFLRTGRVVDVAVSDGDRIDVGKRIASLDGESLRSQRDAALLALAIAEENEKLARRDWDSLKPEQRAAKKLATEQAREAVRAIDVTMKDFSIISPLAGTVSFSDLRVGETVIAGTVVARVSGGGDLVIESQVPESDIAEIVLGMKAVVTFDSLSQNDVFEAEVTGIDTAATVLQGVVSYKTRFRLLSNDNRLKEGMTANIDIETAKAENVLIVPFRAISREAGRSYVEVRRGADSYEKVLISIGIEGDDGLVEVLSGLNEGDEVVVSRK